MRHFLPDTGAYPASLETSTWAKVKAIDAVFQTRLNQGEDKNQVVCESLQQCFDMLIEDQIEKGALHIPATFQLVPDKLLEVAVALEWLPPTMLPDSIVSAHHEWLMKLLSGRIAYFEAAALGDPFGQEPSRPTFVIIPIPEADESTSRKKRGRPTEIPDELKQRALGVFGGKARANPLRDHVPDAPASEERVVHPQALPREV